MLKVFRANLKYLSWVLWAVIAVFMLFVFADFGGRLPSSAPSSTAASIGDHEVTLSELQRSYRALENIQRQVYGERFTQELAQQLQLPLQALEGLVNERILIVEAERMGLAVSDEELRRAILEAGVFTGEDGHFVGDELYGDILRANGYSIAEFESEQRNRLLLRKLTSVLGENLFISEEEAREAYRAEVEKARIRYLGLPTSSYRDQVDLTQQDLNAYFELHQQEFRLPEQRVVAYLLVENAQLRKSIVIEEDAVRAYYDQHADEFRQSEEVRARHILLLTGDQRSPEQAEEELRAVRRRIEGGEDFAALAREVSEDVGTSGGGGDLDYFRRGTMTKPFEDAAFSAQVGELVGPLRTDFGVHLLEVLDHRTEQQRSLDQVRGQIQFRLTQEGLEGLAPKRAQEIHSRLLEQEVSGSESLRSVAQEDEAVSFHATRPLGRFDPVAGRGSWPAFSRAAFELQSGELSEPVRVREGWTILYLEEIREPRIPELWEVEDRVRQSASQEQERELVLAELRRAKQQLAAGASLEQVGRGLGLEVEESDEFGQDGVIRGLGVDPELASEALALEQGQVGEPLFSGDKGVLYEVTSLTRWSPVEFELEKDQIQSGLRQQKLDDLLGALVQQRRQQLEVSYNRELLQALGIEFQPAVG
jgi:peptidyl-prolyl cis-trans isomerase D